MRTILLIAMIWLLSASKGYGQSFTGNSSGTIVVQQVVYVSISTLGAVPNFTTASDYINGKNSLNFATITVKGNVNWLVSVRANAANFTPMTTGASANMPCNKLGIRKNGNSTFLTLSTTDQTLATGNKGTTTTTGNTFNTDMRYNPGFGYNGGIYRMTLVFTITNQ